MRTVSGPQHDAVTKELLDNRRCDGCFAQLQIAPPVRFRSDERLLRVTGRTRS